jgi:hypothetical protein
MEIIKYKTDVLVDEPWCEKKMELHTDSGVLYREMADPGGCVL